MIQTLQTMCQGLEFPADATSYLTEQAEKVASDANAMAALHCATQKAFASDDRSYEESLEKVAELTGVPRYTVDMIFFLSCAPLMQKRFEEMGVGDRIFWDTLRDLRYKLIECKNLYGYYGSFTKNWFPRFLRGEGFALGRLQYEKKPYTGEDYGTLLKKDEPVCKCHIPSSGPLLYEDVLKSLRLAYDFYKEDRKNGILVICCDSWMLYSPLIERLPRTSNIRRFYDLFEIVSIREKATNTDFWRIFSLPYTPENLPAAPENTSLQRTVKAFMMEENNLGCGVGILLFDGEKVLTDRAPS